MNEQNGVGMHCFFSRHNKKIRFHVMGKSITYTTVKSSIQPDTLAKLCEGLNHFLVYYYETDRSTYEKIVFHIYRTFFDIQADRREKMTADGYAANQIPLLIKYCQLDEMLCDWICKYVKDNSVENIDSTDATTDITLNNEHTNVLACMATAVKFSYLHASLLRDNLKFEETMVEFVDPLISNIVAAAEKYFNFNASEEVESDEDFDNQEEMHSYLDNFIIQLVTKTWNGAADASFKRKFEETGKDTFYYARKHKISILTAFKKYLPPAVNDEVAMKYADNKENAKKVYYTKEKDYRDFKFVSKNLAAYIQKTIRNIITTQDTKVDILDVNIPDFIIDGTDERSVCKDVAFFEDKYRHLFDLRKTTAVSLFKQIVDELNKYTINMSFIKKFKIGKNHIFNQVILHKCLLSLTGESRVYSETFGMYNKFLLLLFYLGVKSRPDLNFLHKCIDIMMLDPSLGTLETEMDVEQYLLDHDVKGISARAFGSVLRLYTDGNVTLVLSKDDFLDLLAFMSSPARVRNLLFPDIYTSEEDKVEHYETPQFVDDIRINILKGLV